MSPVYEPIHKYISANLKACCQAILDLDADGMWNKETSTEFFQAVSMVKEAIVVDHGTAIGICESMVYRHAMELVVALQ